MIISCAIYILLICKKKKKFKNKVSIERNPLEMVGIVELNNASVKGQIKARNVKSLKSSTSSNVVIAESESNDNDTLSENSVILIDKLEHSTKDTENKFLDHENCQTTQFPCDSGNNSWSKLVEVSYFENAKKIQVTETADVSAASHDFNADTNNLVECLDKEIGSAGCLEDNRDEFASSETLGKIETKLTPKCCIVHKCIETGDGENVRSFAISLRGESETNLEEKPLHKNEFHSNDKIFQSEDMYLDGFSPNLIDSSTKMDESEKQKDSKEKEKNDDSIEKANTISDINSILECPKNPVVSLLQLLKLSEKGLNRI